MFLKHADTLIERTQTAAQRNAGGTRAEDELVDVFDHAQRSLAEAMTIIIFGKVCPTMPVCCIESILMGIVICTAICK